MQEIQQKNNIFHESIRRRQKQALFTKVRRDYDQLAMFVPDNSLVRDGIAKLMPLCVDVSGLQQNEQELDRLLRYLQRTEQLQKGQLLDDIFVFVGHISGLIHSQMGMDIEYSEGIAQYSGESSPFAVILLRINHFLINFLAESDELTIHYMGPISQLLVSHYYIDCFHNLFLNRLLPPDNKANLLQTYVSLLQGNPTLYLNNLHKFTPAIYYAYFQPPSIAYDEQLHRRVIDLLVKQFSLLEMNQNLTQQQKNDFRSYAFTLVEKWCYRSKDNCRYLVYTLTDSEYLFSDIVTVMKQLRKQLKDFSNLPPNPKNRSKNKLQTMGDNGEVLNCLNLLINLTFFEEICEEIMKQKSPVLWALLLEIYFRLPSAPQDCCLTIEKVLRIVSNTLGDPCACSDFIYYHKQEYSLNPSQLSLSHQQNPDRLLSMEILNRIFSHFYSNPSIRAQCLYLLANVMSITCKNIRTNLMQESASDACQITDIINQSQDMIYEVLKIGKQHQDVIEIVVKNLRFLVEELGELFHEKCPMLWDSVFRAKLKEIADGDDQFEGFSKYSREYAPKTRDAAEELYRALMTSEDDN